MRFTSLLGGLAASLVASAGLAAPATPEQAQAVKSALEAYLGRGADAASSPISTSVVGDHIAVTIDIKRALRGLEAFGLTLEPATYTMDAAPQDGGTWHVTSGGLPRITVKHGADSYSVVMNGSAFDGIFDPRLAGFASSTLTYDSMSIAAIAAIGAKGGTQTREINRGRQTTTASGAGEGIANVQATQSNDGFSQDVTLDAGATGEAGKPDTVSIRGAATTGSLAITELRNRALMDLWAFLVAHPTMAAVKAAQPDLRNLLRQALPLFGRWTQAGSAERVAVESPFGLVALQSVGGQIGVSGLVAQGQFDSEFRFDGLQLPGGVLPAWTEGLLPVSAAIKYGFAGFHLDEAARQVVDAFDLNAKEPLSPAVLESIRTSLGPLDQMVVTLAPSHIASKLVDLRVDGEAKLRQPIPDVHVNVHASGLDKAIQDIQSKSAGDKTASQLIAMLVLAKGLGKAEPDGSLTWVVATGPKGEITVNDLPIPGFDH